MSQPFENPLFGPSFLWNIAVPKVSSCIFRHLHNGSACRFRRREEAAGLIAVELALKLAANKNRIAGVDFMQHDPRALSRRRLLASVAAVPILAASADGRTISGELPWSPFAGEPPRPVHPQGWDLLTPGEAATVAANVDRVITRDPQ